MKLPGPLTPDQEKQLRTVQSSGKHLLSLINDLLDLAKIESGKVELNTEPVVCQSVIRDVVASLEPLARSKNLEFNALMPERDLILQTDRRALNQILINLTNNAIKFTEKGRVQIEMRRFQDNGRWRTDIVVTDTSHGRRRTGACLARGPRAGRHTGDLLLGQLPRNRSARHRQSLRRHHRAFQTGRTGGRAAGRQSGPGRPERARRSAGGGSHPVSPGAGPASDRPTALLLAPGPHHRAGPGSDQRA